MALVVSYFYFDCIDTDFRTGGGLSKEKAERCGRPDAASCRERRAIPSISYAWRSCYPLLPRTQTVDESDATTLTAFCSRFVMPSWRVMLTSQRGDEQATAAS
eukprot:scaffold9445_cov78-Skeletonema_dohrnii-CCMP3373.AAC.2